MLTIDLCLQTMPHICLKGRQEFCLFVSLPQSDHVSLLPESDDHGASLLLSAQTQTGHTQTETKYETC